MCPLCKNICTITDTQYLANLPTLQVDEEDVSYDDESLFTNMPVLETIDILLNKFFVHDKIKPVHDVFFNQHKKNVEYILFKRLNNYHQNTKLTFDINPI